MNIYDVSRRAGVSIATVSRVLNGNPNVSQKTRSRVLAVMDELGYTPNVFARGLGLGTMKTIGIMCSDSSDPYLANAIYYLERQLRSHGYDSILCCTGTSLENKRTCFELLLSKRVDAMILAGIGDFSRFDSPSRLLAYAGMSPSTYQSGQLKNCYPHMEKRGSRYLRYALYNAAKYVCHWDPAFAAYLAKKRAEGKHYNVALSHAAKKLVRLIFALERSKQSYCPTV